MTTNYVSGSRMMTARERFDQPSEVELSDVQDISLKFIRAIKRVHGAEKATEVINSLSETLGKQWSSRIIFDMLTYGPEDVGRYRFFIRSSIMFSNIIQVIKGHRSVTREGLRESKNAVEKLREEIRDWEEKVAKEKGYLDKDKIPLAEYRDAPHFIVEFPPDAFDRQQRLDSWRDAGGFML